MGIGDWGLGPIPNPQSPYIMIIWKNLIKSKNLNEPIIFKKNKYSKIIKQKNK